MSSIKYLNTTIEITNNGGFATDQNRIAYTISSELADAETMQQIFPNRRFILSGNKLQFNDSVVVQNMSQIIDTTLISADDINKPVIDAIKKWAVNIIYDSNFLSLDKEKWAIV